MNTSDVETLLLPCPLCGGEPKLDDDDVAVGEVYIYCKKCSMTFEGSTVQRAVVGWNNRRATGLVNWVEAEMKKYYDNPGQSLLDAKFQELKRVRKMIKRLLNQ